MACALRTPLVAFVLLVFIIAPLLCLALGLCFGAILAAAEGWPVGGSHGGFWYVTTNIAGTPPVGSESPTSTMGITVDIIVSTISLVFASTIIALSGMLAFVGNLPGKLQLDTTWKALLAVLIVIPAAVCVVSAAFGAILTVAEEATFDQGFRFVISSVCGLGNPLTTWSPTTIHASMISVALGVASQGLIGVIIGIAGGITPIVNGVGRFDVYFGDTAAAGGGNPPAEEGVTYAAAKPPAAKEDVASVSADVLPEP